MGSRDYFTGLRNYNPAYNLDGLIGASPKYR